ncbi:hypothetical protein N7474_003636 [Penicillium riverlandense]|uniref:uncharacterized protein n=1 Tax=Penicillium riverlandense TaxID=1903569 RepID=UPI002548E23A|nr:uncharacterized protein N7474_003636 [Penicillium riverlandense]KAJ5818045.1 hypothetical protein N7474_003636 [Penicillium riverlandense]
MLTSSSTDVSSQSSSSSSGEPSRSPYRHPQPASSLSLGSQRPRRDTTAPKCRRFYSSPVDEGIDSTPLQMYGLEQRPPSFVERPPKLLRRVSHALDEIKEDYSLQLDVRATADKLKRRSTLFLFDGSNTAEDSCPRPQTSMTASAAPRSRPMSIMSFDAWSSPPRRLSRRLTRRISSWRHSKAPAPPTASISSPNLIGSSTLHRAGRSQASFI